MLDLVIDIGNSRIKGALFEEKTLIDVFSFPAQPTPHDQLVHYLEGKPIANVLISSVNSKAESGVKNYLDQKKIVYRFLDYKALKMTFDVDEPEQLGHDRIANAYGALSRFSINDCIIVDIGTAITLDFVTKEGHYLGGMIYLGADLCSKALSDYTDKLPRVSPGKPESALAKTTVTHLQAGIYYGQLGAIERMIAELRLTAVSPSSVKIIATGGATTNEPVHAPFIEDLRELVDFIDPHLTLVGLHEILIETAK